MSDRGLPYRGVIFEQSEENMVTPFTADLQVAARESLLSKPDLP
jgi:hypothetical protein